MVWRDKVSPLVLSEFETSTAKFADDFSKDMSHSSYAKESEHAPAFKGCESSSAVGGGGPHPLGGGASLASGGGVLPTIVVEDASSVVGDLLPPVGEDASSLAVGGAPPLVAGDVLLPVGGGLTPLSAGDQSVEPGSQVKAKPSASSIRRSKRQAAKRDKKYEDGSILKLGQTARSRKSLFPMFISLKRNIAQAISPEGKYKPEPGSKKSL